MVLLFSIRNWLSKCGLLFLASTSAAPAQTSPADAKPDTQVYNYVEKMPQLPGGGGTAAIVAAIQHSIRYPVTALLAHAQGRTIVRFTIAADGTVQQVAVVRGFRADCDSAVVKAVRQLPRFEPGIQAGRPVAVSLAVPITFRMTVTQLPPTIAH